MTRDYFEDYVEAWEDLFDLCRENGLDTLDEVYEEDTYNDAIRNELLDQARHNAWYDVLSWLSDLPQQGEGYYYCGDYGWEVADFDDFKNAVCGDMDYYGYWEEDEDDEDNDIDDDIDDDDEDDEDVTGDYGDHPTEDEAEIDDSDFFGVLSGRDEDVA